MALQQDRMETVVTLVDEYSKELKKYQAELLKATGQIEKLGTSGKGAGNGIDSLIGTFGGLKGILASLGIVKAVKELGKIGLECLNAASSIKELDNVLEQVFGRGKEDIAKWANAMSSEVGRASYELQKNASIFGAIFKGSGIKTDDFQDMSVTLAQLTADFSSFFEVADEEAFTALKSGITGEAEPLKRFGVILTETTAAE